jgi:hypothetical protein
MNRSAQAHAMRCRLAKRLLVICFALSLVPLTTAQQAPAKRPLTHSDYDNWRSIQQQQLTQDGKFLAYVLNPQDADGEVVARNLTTGVEWRHPHGHRPETTTPAVVDDQQRPAAARGAGPGGGGAASGLAFTADGRFLIFQIFPTKAEQEAAKKANARPADAPQNAMGIMDLSSGKVDRIERVRRFQVPEEGAGFVGYLLEPKPEDRPAQGRSDTGGAANPPAAGRQGGAGGRQGGAAAGRRPAARTEYGSDLVVRSLVDKSERTIPDVLEFAFRKDAKSLIYAVSSRTPENNGVYRIEPGTTGSPTPVLTGKGKYTRLTWDEKQNQLAFFSDRDDAAAPQPKVKIYYCDAQNPSAV